MACDTCGHTMGKLCDADGKNFFHCERCGTIVVAMLGWRQARTPMLVTRCREFQRLHRSNFDEFMADDWRSLGIAEAIGKVD